MLTNLASFNTKPGQTQSLGKALTDLVEGKKPDVFPSTFINLFKLQKTGAHK